MAAPVTRQLKSPGGAAGQQTRLPDVRPIDFIILLNLKN